MKVLNLTENKDQCLCGSWNLKVVQQHNKSKLNLIKSDRSTGIRA